MSQIPAKIMIVDLIILERKGIFVMNLHRMGIPHSKASYPKDISMVMTTDRNERSVLP